jgi:hypothetical protein
MAAQRDEKNGFRFTAAMEWHKAALLFVPTSTLAELCWRKWERIVHLPRHMAEPIRDQQPSYVRASERSFAVCSSSNQSRSHSSRSSVSKRVEPLMKAS